MEAKNKTCATSKCSITKLLGNKTKPRTERFWFCLLTENWNNNNLSTDIGDINYVLGEEELKKQITEPFCDYIMVVKITDSMHCEGDLSNF